MNEERERAREEYGFERLGPIVADFLHDLEGVLERLARQRGGRALFVSRAGLMIRHALGVYRAARGSDPRPDEAPFYVSRFLAAKGVWLRAPQRALAVLDREFGTGNASSYLLRMGLGAASDEGRLYSGFSEFMQMAGPDQDRCRDHLETQAKRFEAYISGLFGGYPLVALVDTGWQGTIQSLLTHAFPDREIWGVNFGRHGSEIDPAISGRLFGLAFSGGYDERRPLSAIVHYRHLIEALFEPIGDSVETLDEVGGAITPRGADALSAENLRPSQPALYGGMLRYLRETAGAQSYSALVREKKRAAQRLAEDILFPSRETARLLGGLSSSFDFGRRDSRAALVEPGTPDGGAEARIGVALWKQGQIALECRPAIARERQRALLPKRRSAREGDEPQRAWDPARPKVAIAMRTMDRLIFLQRAFEGIARQTFDDYVLVVFNDGGDVAGVEGELQNSWLDRRKVILVDGVENRGMEAASNAAIRSVNSDYVVVHDDDDSWVREFLAATADFLDENKLCAGVITRSYRIDEEISGDQIVIRERSGYNDNLRAVQLGELLAGNIYPPISFLFRRSCYDQVGGFNENLPVLGDWDFNIKVAARGEIGVIRKRLANYHHRSAAGGAYSNSVVGGSDLHLRYNPVVRVGLLHDEHLRSLAGAVAVAPMVNELYRFARLAASGPGSLEADMLATAADDRWCLLAYAEARPDQIGALTLSAALRHGATHGIPIPPDFEEAAYLAQYPDVNLMVRDGRYPSGYVHFMLQGRAEGRRRASARASGDPLMATAVSRSEAACASPPGT